MKAAPFLISQAPAEPIEVVLPQPELVLMTVHNDAYLFLLLFSFQSSFFLWITLSLFLLFIFAFIFTSRIAHICSSVIENECSALRFLLFKQGLFLLPPREIISPSAQQNFLIQVGKCFDSNSGIIGSARQSARGI